MSLPNENTKAERVSRRLDKLDHILTSCESLRKFVTDARARSEYFDAMQAYYGASRFPESSFEHILDQLKFLLNEVPEIEERLMRPAARRYDLSLALNLERLNLRLQPLRWAELAQQWQQDVVAQALERGVSRLDVNWQKFREDLDEYREREKRYLRKLEVVTKGSDLEDRSAIQAIQEEHHKQLAKWGFADDLALKAVAVYAISRSFFNVSRSRDAERVASEISLRREFSMSVVRRVVQWGAVPKSIESLVLKRLLSIDQLHEQGILSASPSAVTQMSEVAAVQLREAPRPFHSIFRGIECHEYLGGDHRTLTACTPLRWATVALEDSVCLHVHVDDINAGYIEFSPVTNGRTRELSISLQSPLLIRKCAGHYVADRVLQSLGEKIQQKYVGFVLSRAQISDDVSACDAAHETAVYKQGQWLGDAEAFFSPDPLAERIEAIAPWPDDLRNWKRTMLLNSGLQGSQMLMWLGTKWL